MKKIFISAVTALSIIGLTHCSNPGKRIFNGDALAVQKFEIDVYKDTLIKTTAGMVVSIKAGSLSSSNSDKVVLQIKEALQLADMIKAGLTTTANGELLSSGGMFFIEPEDKSVQIVSPLTVYVPTDFIEKTNLYTGNERDEKINWEDPAPVQVPEQSPYIEGKALFEQNCTQCHSIGKGVVIGPDLVHITKRRDYNWLEEFTLNSQGFLRSCMPEDVASDSLDLPALCKLGVATNDTTARYPDFYCLYSICHFNEYNKTVMPAFNFTHDEMHLIYDYIENASNRLPMPEDKLFHCVDSCLKYRTIKKDLEQKRNALIRDNGKLLNVENLPVGTTTDTTGPVATDTTRVELVAVAAKYYQVNIKAFGWYNIDILLKDVNGVKNSNLIVRLRGTFQKDISLFLVIPSHKVFVEGGELTTGNGDYGFFEKNGTIPLPQEQTVYVFAVGEANRKFIFGNAEFTASTQQIITIEPVEVSKETFDAAIQKMSAGEMNVSLDKTKNADQIIELDKKLTDAENLKPKNCDCDCGNYVGEAAYRYPK